MGQTFDDGILTIYDTANTAAPGDKPAIQLKERERFYFSYQTVSYQRVYEAMQAKQKADEVVCIPGWNRQIRTLDICSLDDGTQYQINVVQPALDNDGLRITRLTLERRS